MSFLRIIALLLIFTFASAYEYYTFAMEVPGTVCKYKKCQASMMGSLGPNTLNLHGLWPDTADASKRPFDCQADLYDESQLDATLKQEMDKTWVGLYNSTFWFRYHEWGKHGTCWQETSSEQRYIYA